MRQKLLILTALVLFGTQLFAGVPTVPTITITAPSELITFEPNDDVILEWEYEDPSELLTSLKLMFSIDNVTYFQGSGPIDKDDASYTFNIPSETEDGDYYFRIQDITGTYTSEAKVYTVATPVETSITITAPSEETIFEPNDNVSFEWEYEDPSELLTSLILMFSEDNLEFEQISNTFDKDDANYSFNVPSEAEDGDYYFRIQDATGTYISESKMYTVETPIENYTISGVVTYDGITEGDLILFVCLQTDFELGDFTNVVASTFQQSLMTPHPFTLNNIPVGNYALVAYLDYDGDTEFDDGEEPIYTQENITVSDANITDIDVYLEEPIVITADFSMDFDQSYFYHPAEDFTGSFNPLVGGFFETESLNNLTAKTMNSFEVGDGLYSMGFWIKENEGEANNLEDELVGSYLDAGTVLHLEYIYSSDLEINFIAVGSIVTGVVIEKGAQENRLILDLTVVNPVESASGDFGASCGISISCNIMHSGGVSAEGSVFFGDLYSHDMGLTVTQGSDMIGLRVNGENGIEAHLTGLLADKFLINAFGFDANNMPTTSAELGGEIPDLSVTEYSVDNSFAVIDAGFDVDGDELDNKMYKVVINNSSWSEHDLLMGENPVVTNINALEKTEETLLVLENGIQVLKAVQSINAYNTNGDLVYTGNDLEQGSIIPTSSWDSGIYIVVADEATVKVKK